VLYGLASKGKNFWIYKFVINRSAVRLRAGAPLKPSGFNKLSFPES